MEKHLSIVNQGLLGWNVVFNFEANIVDEVSSHFEYIILTNFILSKYFKSSTYR